jgi:succinate dehydrogenase hydrophobic anchor subunit
MPWALMTKKKKKKKKKKGNLLHGRCPVRISAATLAILTVVILFFLFLFSVSSEKIAR